MKKKKKNNKNTQKRYKLCDKKNYKNQSNKIKKITGIFAIIIMLLYMIVITVRLNVLENKIIEIGKTKVTLEQISPNYVFLGDSITERYDIDKYFEGYSVVNSGVGGDTTEDILESLKERVYRYNPSTIFLMIGTNDVNEDKSAEYIFNNIKRIVNGIQIHLPETKIFVQSILPAGNNWAQDGRNEKREKINKFLQQEYQNGNVTYINLYDDFVNSDNKELKTEYSNDGLHLNDDGYKLISKKLKKFMLY